MKNAQTRIGVCLLAGLLLIALGQVAFAAQEPGLPPVGFEPNTTTGISSLDPYYSASGEVSMSIDGLGILGASGLIQVDKPAGATVRAAFFAAASTGFREYMIPDGTISLNGSPVNWDATLASSIFSYNFIADVTGIVKPTVDAAAPGTIDLSVIEGSMTGNIDGTILAVVFDDPNVSEETSAVVFFGAQNIAGDDFAIGLTRPAEPNNPDYILDVSLGISFSYYAGNQYSVIDVNGARLTTSSGCQDDGEAGNGALITVGGIGDLNANPADPFALPDAFDNRTDDEFYDLKPFVGEGDLVINLRTANPSNDDNIFFAALLASDVVRINESASLSPSTATRNVGSTHTVCASVQNDAAEPIAGREVVFEVLSGPNNGMVWTVTTDAAGQACISYVGNTAGADVITASFTNSDGALQYSSNNATVTWEIPVTPGCVWADGTIPPLDNGEDGHGASWGDFDNDGDDDLFLSNAGENALLRNDGGGTFTRMPNLYNNGGDSRGAAWGDYDNDGDLDLYVVNYGSSNRLYRNDGGGMFADVTAGDLACPLQGNNAAWADYDNDGDLDLFFTNYDGPNKLLNNDGGTFTMVMSEVGFTDLSRGCAWGDYDNDQDLDLYVSVEDGANHLFRNDRGVMVDVTVAPLDDMGKGKGVAWGDYDNDGDQDLYLVNRFTANRLFVNDGMGGFSISADVATADEGDGRACGWGDYNNDGWLDLYITNWSTGTNKLFHNEMGTSFADTTCGALLTPISAWGMGWNDYDGDGDLDIYVQAHSWMGDPSYMFRNDLITAKSWLSVQLRGTQSNRQGIGARVVASDPTSGRSFTREITAGSGYMSQQSAVAQFGLDDATTVDLTIYWPSGKVQTLENLSVDRRLVIGEQASTTGVGDVTGVLGYSTRNYPNPFNPMTNIEFSQVKAGAVTLQVFDVNGRHVRTLLSGAPYDAGTFTVPWNGRNAQGRSVASGVYFYRFSSGAHEETGRMMLLK